MKELTTFSVGAGLFGRHMRRMSEWTKNTEIIILSNRAVNAYHSSYII